jgi:hypothetical protein
MNLLEKMAKKWAEKNSSPGIEGRNELYEFLIEVQAQAYQSGFLKAKEMAVDRTKYARFSIILSDTDFIRGFIEASKKIQSSCENLGEDESTWI